MTYRCSRCGNERDEFGILCPWCGAWMSGRSLREARAPGPLPVPLPDVRACSRARLKTRSGAIDRLVAGGFVPGTSVLLAGPPGAGKSTLILQILDSSGAASLYASGEESIEQLKLRADRLHISSRLISVLFETNVTLVEMHVKKALPRVLVIDSIQTAFTDLSDSLPGTAAQVRRCTGVLRRLAQEKGFVLLLVGQVTKGLKAAGPKMLEHAVDCVLALSFCEGEPGLRTLSVVKNRFGPAGNSLPLPFTGGGFFLGKR